MRCISCNKILNDFESTRRYVNTNEYVDMCMKCFKNSDTENIDVIERADLKPEESIEEFDSDNEDDGSEYLGCGGGQCG